jgi:hypothetical protein
LGDFVIAQLQRNSNSPEIPARSRKLQNYPMTQLLNGVSAGLEQFAETEGLPVYGTDAPVDNLGYLP